MVNHNVNHKNIALINSLKNKEKIKILFVCLGNICRSPAADGIMHSIIKSHADDEHWFVDSAGTYGGHAGDMPDKRMCIHAVRRGYKLTHRSRQIKESDFSDFDIIIAMDSANERSLKRMAPTVEAEAKVVPMSRFFRTSTRYDHVPDPYYEGAEGFELVLDLLEDACGNLYDQLTTENGK